MRTPASRKTLGQRFQTAELGRLADQSASTSCAYPIEFIKNSKIPCMTDKHPSNIIYVSVCAKRR